MNPQKGRNESEISETLMSGLDFLAKALMWLGLLASVVSLGFLIFYVFFFANAAPTQNLDQIKTLVELFRKVLTFGLLAAFIGSAFLFWGEGWLEIVQLVISLFCYFAPALASLFIGNISGVSAFALSGLQRAGMGAGIVAVGVLVIDSFIKVQARLKQGTKADQLKYGKGIKEETDRKNVFLGKCWQLPYCRKFVRERCPIYHAKRTCWRERVGCMCEEEVIKGAMENRAIPKDMVAAARYIPQNNKITLGQKMERCRQCVIYNEHQKHKYRAALPAVIVVLGGVLAFSWTALMGRMHILVHLVQSMINKATIGNAPVFEVPDAFQMVMVGCFALIVFAYSLKLLEFLIFKLKV
ncbi:MAG: hypothetical protein QOJ65_568 [Fimbriimonadaceae bacterium]|jgi:hypothetical protein|nr:hypothetical protein [Fimbriimonadaceae bacterium]